MDGIRYLSPAGFQRFQQDLCCLCERLFSRAKLGQGLVLPGEQAGDQSGGQVAGREEEGVIGRVGGVRT